MSGLTWHREELSRTEMVACWWQMGCNGFLLERWMDLVLSRKNAWLYNRRRDELSGRSKVNDRDV